MEEILNGRMDVGYGTDIDISHFPGLAAQILGEWRGIAFMASDCPLASKKKISLEDMFTYTVILYSGKEHGEDMAELFRHAFGRNPHKFQVVNSLLCGFAYALAGLGIGLAPAPLRFMRIPGLVYRPLAHIPSAKVSLTFIQRIQEPSPAVRAFIQFAKAKATLQSALPTHASTGALLIIR